MIDEHVILGYIVMKQRVFKANNGSCFRRRVMFRYKCSMLPKLVV